MLVILSYISHLEWVCIVEEPVYTKSDDVNIKAFALISVWDSVGVILTGFVTPQIPVLNDVNSLHSLQSSKFPLYRTCQAYSGDFSDVIPVKNPPDKVCDVKSLDIPES